MKNQKPIKLESALRSMNRLITNAVKTFGINSEEYGQLKFLAESANKDIGLFIRHEKNMPIQFKRSKKAMTGLSKISDDVFETYQAMRDLGTIMQQIHWKYDPTMTSRRLESSESDRKIIKQMAMQRAAIRRTVSAWYGAIDDIDDPTAQAKARKMFGNTKGTKGEERDTIADEAIEFVRKCLIEQGDAVKSGVAFKPKNERISNVQVIGKSVTLGEAIGKQKG